MQDPADADAPPALREIAAGLSAALEGTEGGFLEVGRQLDAALGVFDRLTGLFEALPQELQGEAVEGAARTLGELAPEIAAFAAGLDGEGEAVARMLRRTELVGGRIEQLRRPVRVIGLLAMNMRIAAAQLGSDTEGFAIFAQEISRLAGLAAATIEDYARSHEALDGHLRAAAARQAAFAGEQKVPLEAAVAALEQGIGEIEERRREDASLGAQIGERSRAIGQAVATVVASLQIGDITRQRVEHVVEALDEAGANPATDAETGPLCRLQASQLDHAAAAFDAELGRAIRSLEELAGEAGAIVASGSDSYRGGGASFLDRLDRRLQETGRLIEQCHAGRTELDRLIAAASEAGRALLQRMESVHRIEEDVRLAALNTTLKCQRLDQAGRTLAVIAQELRNHAAQTVEAAAALEEALAAVADDAQTFERGRAARSADRIAGLYGRMTDALGIFRAGGERLDRALAALGEEGTIVRALLAEAASGSTRERTLTARLAEAAERLNLLAGPVTPDQEAATAALLGRVQERYTMASERAIHAGAAAIDHPREQSLDDILF